MSLDARLVLLVLLALLPTLAIQAWSGMELREEREAELRTQVLTEAREVQAGQSRLAEAAQQLLIAASEAPSLRQGDPPTCTSYLTGIARRTDTYVLLAASGPDGTIICNSDGSAAGSYTNAERAYFQRAWQTGRFAAGDLVTGTATHRPTLHFALPFQRMDGTPGGVVIAGVDQATIARQLAEPGLQENAIALAIDPAGTVIAAVRNGKPVAAPWLGRSAPPAIRAALLATGPTTLVSDALDGSNRLFGIAPAARGMAGIATAVAFDQEHALQPITIATGRNLASLALGGALALAAGVVGGRRFVLRPLARLTAAADAVRQGKLGARSDLGRRSSELREVGAAFDRMSAALAVREAERDRAEAARHQATEALHANEARERESLTRFAEELEQRVRERTAELTDVLSRLHQEIGERERVEDALRQSQKMEVVGQLTGGIAHDFNNMLQAIGGSLELMQRRIGQGRMTEAVSYVEAARKTVARAAALTHRLLGFARRQALQPRAFDPAALAAGMAELLSRTVGPSITLALEDSAEGAAVLCDPNQLENAVLNLAINARDAMPEGGTLRVGIALLTMDPTAAAAEEGASAGVYVDVSVADTGTGMDAATQARAFEPFFTTKPIGQGTGLGLSQLYGFVRQSGGFVRLRSAPDAGTVVHLLLPRHDPMPAATEEAGPHAPVDADGEQILLVEDEDDVRALMVEHLLDLGYRVCAVPNGSAALAALAGAELAPGRLRALVTDVGLPGPLNGRQVADAVRERHPDLPVLFITGYAGGALEGGLALGMELIGKPFTLDQLAGRLRTILERG